MSLCFYKRDILVPVFVNQKKLEDIHFYEIVIVSSLITISTYERFHRNAPLSDSGGNLYTFPCGAYVITFKKIN